MNEATKKKRCSYQHYPPFADDFPGFSGVFPGFSGVFPGFFGVFPGLSPNINIPASGTSFSPFPLVKLPRRRDSFIPKKEEKK